MTIAADTPATQGSADGISLTGCRLIRACHRSRKTRPDRSPRERSNVRQRSEAPIYLLQFCTFDVVVPEAVFVSVSLPAASLQRSLMPFGVVVEFVAFGSTGVVEVPEPEPAVPLASFVVPGVVPEPLLELEPFDCAIADVANVSASTAVERSLTIMVDLLVVYRHQTNPLLIVPGEIVFSEIPVKRFQATADC
ncbi:hypothetical protein [Mesorhizobium sp. M0239]|uniref:hypothetical protein n=1 Tax=Mesorhizobium sp. M0239 TaxID=2956924 RepID=UPI00333BE6E3